MCTEGAFVGGVGMTGGGGITPPHHPGHDMGVAVVTGGITIGVRKNPPSNVRCSDPRAGIRIGIIYVLHDCVISESFSHTVVFLGDGVYPARVPVPTNVRGSTRIMYVPFGMRGIPYVREGSLAPVMLLEKR